MSMNSSLVQPYFRGLPVGDRQIEGRADDPLDQVWPRPHRRAYLGEVGPQRGDEALTNSSAPGTSRSPMGQLPPSVHRGGGRRAPQRLHSADCSERRHEGSWRSAVFNARIIRRRIVRRSMSALRSSSFNALCSAPSRASSSRLFDVGLTQPLLVAHDVPASDVHARAHRASSSSAVPVRTEPAMMAIPTPT